MANLSNINNILRTGSLGVGINRDPASPFEVSSSTKPGIKMFNTAASGKTYQAYSDVNGNYIIYDEDADSNRLVINSAGNATFAGDVYVTGTSNSNVVISRDNMYVDAGQFYIGADGATTDDTFRQRVTSGSYFIESRKSGTWTNRLQINSAGTLIASQGATFGGDVTVDGTVLIDGLSNYTGLEVKGAGASRPQIKFSNVNQGTLAQIYGTESNSLVTTVPAGLEYQVRNANGASGNHVFKSYNTAILTLDGGTNNATFAGNITFGDGHFIGDDADDNLLIQSSANENIIINSVDDLFLRTGGTTKLTVKNGGNVGIGTPSPGAQLHNYSTAATNVFITGHGTAAQNDWGAQNCMFVKTDNGLLISKANAANNTNRIFNFYNDNNGYAQLYMHAGATAFVKIQASGDSYFNGGNVGIGDTAPTSISVNTSSLSVNSSRTDLSGGLISKANGTVKHQQYWDSSGYSFNLSASSGVFKFNGAEVQVNANIKANDIDGKLYSMAASWAYVASKNDLFSYPGTEGAVWEYTIKMNPNTAGSGSYRDYYYGKLGIGIGWNGSNVTQFLWQQQDQTAPRSLYSSGGGNFNPLFRMYYSGGVYTELAINTAWTLRIQGLSTTTYGDIFFRRLA